MFESFFNFIFDRVQPEKGDRLIVKGRYKRAERNAERGRRNKTMRQSYDLQNGRKKTAAMGKRYCEGEIGYAERKKVKKTDMQIPKREGTTFERFCGDAAYKKAASFTAVAGARGRAADGFERYFAGARGFNVKERMRYENLCLADVFRLG